MYKDIYIIRNKINGKIYIGQAINSKERWYHHCNNAEKPCPNGAIDNAIKKYGKENFTLEVIERVENYNEREKYWIKFYDCKIPNGYNIKDGGEGVPSLESANSIIRNPLILKNIFQDIQNGILSLQEIANKYQLSKTVVSSINRGKTYHDDNYNYPLRKRFSDNYNKEKDREIFDELLNTKNSYREIAEKYSVTTFYVGEINKGNCFKQENINYPLRKKEQNPIYEIIKEKLQTSTLSLRALAKELNVSYSMVQSINSGRYHRDDWRDYPIRKKS